MIRMFTYNMFHVVFADDSTFKGDVSLLLHLGVRGDTVVTVDVPRRNRRYHCGCGYVNYGALFLIFL